jgi:gamma-glutamyltranspeptidase
LTGDGGRRLPGQRKGVTQERCPPDVGIGAHQPATIQVSWPALRREIHWIFNCRGDYYSLVAGEANAPAPGKRPRSTLQSTLVMKDGKPFMIVGSPGGDDQVFRTMQTLMNVVDFGMNVQEAIEAPRWAAIIVDPKTGVLSAGTDPCVDAYAIAW